MIKASIILGFKNGEVINYANKDLAPKTGNDNYTGVNGDLEPTKLIAGVPGICYYYTGEGTDTYENQTGTGKAKTDYEYFMDQLKKNPGNDLLKFPEDGDTTTLVRDWGETLSTGLTNDRISFKLSELVSVKLNEEWIPYPGNSADPESYYMFPKSSPNFRGTDESRHPPIFGKGPDFDKNFIRGNGFIPNPQLDIDDNGDVIVLNENEYDEVKRTETPNGVECYGIKDEKKSGVSFISLR